MNRFKNGFLSSVAVYLALMVGTVSVRAGETMYAAGEDGTALIAVDLDTGATTVVGDFGHTGTWAAAFTPDGTLWTLTNWGNELATVNLATGAATIVGPTGAGETVLCLEADCDGNLYALGWSGILYLADQTTGALTPIAATTIGFAMDLAFDSNGTLWALDFDSSLWSIDVSTGTSTFHATLNRPMTMGLVIDRSDNFYVTDFAFSPVLGSLDSTTGVVTVVGAIASPYVLGGDVMPNCAIEVQEVQIDIKPGSDPNSINRKSKGVVPVAILTTDDFDAATVNPGTVAFAGASAEKSSLEDVDGDGDLDMILHFKTQSLNLTATSTEATLTGETTDGHPFTGTDSVRIVR